VRLGRHRAVWLYVVLSLAAFAVIVSGVQFGVFPRTSLVCLLAFPLLAGSARTGIHAYENPRRFTPAIRQIVTCYVVTVMLFTASIAAAALQGVA
jgi:1,4-dihydroxy-2-naphthoate octaprenyltransferase